MVVVFDDVRGEAVAEDVSAALVPEVEVTCVAAVQPVHPLGEIGLGAAEQQVVVRAHQAVAEALDPELQERPAEQREKHAAIDVVHEQRAVEHREPGDVVDAVREHVSRPPRHGAGR